VGFTVFALVDNTVFSRRTSLPLAHIEGSSARSNARLGRLEEAGDKVAETAIATAKGVGVIPKFKNSLTKHSRSLRALRCPHLLFTKLIVGRSLARKCKRVLAHRLTWINI
jgi:hypothetical protein